MKTSIILEILEGVDGLATDEQAKKEMKSLIHAVCLGHGMTGVVFNERVNTARKLLSMRISRPTIRDRLVALYGISPSQAYRYIHKALQLSHIAIGNATEVGCNSVIEIGVVHEPDRQEIV